MQTTGYSDHWALAMPNRKIHREIEGGRHEEEAPTAAHTGGALRQGVQRQAGRGPVRVRPAQGTQGLREGQRLLRGPRVRGRGRERPSRKQAPEVRIKDNGGGIPPDVAEKIFNPFFTTKPTDRGTGLGLAISSDIVRKHGGAIPCTRRTPTRLEGDGCRAPPDTALSDGDGRGERLVRLGLEPADEQGVVHLGAGNSG